jgi:hypothetical protein
MSEPIEYMVLRDLQAALMAITIAAGYHYEVAGTAVKLDPNHEVDELVAPGGPRPFIVLEPKSEAAESWAVVEKPSGVRLVMPITIHWVNDSDPEVDESCRQVYYRGCADIERAIAVDTSRGGLAVDTRIVRRAPEVGQDGAQVWAVIDVEIVIYRTYGQPNAA